VEVANFGTKNDPLNFWSVLEPQVQENSKESMLCSAHITAVNISGLEKHVCAGKIHNYTNYTSK